MQYKIPVQIENEDPIFLWLSLRQLAIIMVGWGISYSVFQSLTPSAWGDIAAIPAVIIFIITIMIAIFKQYEMTFVPFLLAFLRFQTNMKDRKWIAWVDSFQPIDIWFVTNITDKKEEKIDFKSKIDKIKEIDDKLNKI